MKKLALAALASFALFGTKNGFAMGGESAQDPVRSIRYSDAFDHTQIDKKFKKHLVAQGCEENVFGAQKGVAEQENAVAIDVVASGVDVKHEVEGTENARLLVSMEPQAQPITDPKVQAEYEKACLAKLYSARKWAIVYNARENMSLLSLLVCAAGTTTAIIGNESMGGSFSIFAVVFSSAHLLKEPIRAAYNLRYPPAHSLNEYEERFAKNKCYIPKALWGKIKQEFENGRQNQFAQLKAMDFLEFALGLTSYKPKPALILSGSKLDQIAQVLHNRIDEFFKDYEYRAPQTAAAGSAGAASDKDLKLAKDTQTIGDFCGCLKINTDKFIESLAGNKEQAPRYVYLFGPGGIGKTHFISQLCTWIEELIPGSVRFENMIITTPTELEGSSDKPGAFLRVLRNQLMSNKRASVVFMDEATWLNDGGMVNPAKRVFNGNLSKISTSLFGDGVEGTGIDLEVPPMFIFCAGNKEIEDPALASRFDRPHYPMPKHEALVKHAAAVASKSVSLKRESVAVGAQAQNDIASWIQKEKIEDFRRAASEVELYLLQKRARSQASATAAAGTVAQQGAIEANKSHDSKSSK